MRNLYYLKGNAVLGDVAMVNSVVEDTTRIWHMHLAHASKKSLYAVK